MRQARSVLCKFEVAKTTYQGRRAPINYISGETKPEGDVWAVELYPYNPTEADDPNMAFFETTPSGQIQFWSVMNFAPPIGTVVDVLITVPEGVPLQQEPPAKE